MAVLLHSGSRNLSPKTPDSMKFWIQRLVELEIGTLDDEAMLAQTASQIFKVLPDFVIVACMTFGYHLSPLHTRKNHAL